MNKSGRGKFLKGERVTSTGTIFAEAKKEKKVIGPHTYHPYKNMKEKILGMPKQTSESMQFVADCKFTG
jgi:hypothetical protein